MKKIINQDEIFLKKEGDAWFSRNKDALINDGKLISDHIIMSFNKAKLPHPSNIIEIGASNGYRLNYFQHKFNSRVTAVDPSIEAIEDGKKRFPKIKFHRATASHIPIEDDSSFDLVIINFVFHWIDRSKLLKSVSEIDRLLIDKGHLIIGDFYPNYPIANAYHHIKDQEVYTFKQNYAQIFIESNIYTEIFFEASEHNPPLIGKNEYYNRSLISILKKDLSGLYKR